MEPLESETTASKDANESANSATESQAQVQISLKQLM